MVSPSPGVSIPPPHCVLILPPYIFIRGDSGSPDWVRAFLFRVENKKCCIGNLDNIGVVPSGL